MEIVESSALAIVALYVVGRAAIDRERGRFLARFVLLAAASWASEQSAILLYDAYHYARSWWLFAGDVPLSVALIWPCVIHGAWDLASSLARTRDRAGAGARRIAAVALGGGLLVLGDASLIEPIAVRAGLWAWRDPGLFDVPLIGLVGWGLHAGACIGVLELVRARRWPSSTELALLLAAPLATHAGLLACWWGALRSVAGPVPGPAAAAVVWTISALLVVAALRTRARERVVGLELWLRVPAASYFLVLLVLVGLSDAALVAYAAAFVPPWIAILRWPSRASSPLDAPRSGRYTATR